MPEVCTIRNPAKRRYAHEQLGYLVAFPGQDRPERGSLSLMAAQAVEMKLSELIESVPLR